MKKIFVCIFVGLLLSLAGCIGDKYQKGIDIDKTPQVVNTQKFRPEVIATGDFSGYSENRSELYVITHEGEWDLIGLKIENFDISQIDFRNELLIIILLGEKPNTGYKLNISEIKKKDTSVEVFAHIEEHAGGIDVNTSPYAIIKIKKIEIAKDKAEFKLFLNNEEFYVRKSMYPIKT